MFRTPTTVFCWVAAATLLITFLTTNVVHADVRISSFNDLIFDNWFGSGDLEEDDNLCVYNEDGSSYRVTMSGSGGGGAFSVTRGAETVSYSALFRGSSGGFVSMSPGASMVFCCADEVSDTCSGGTNAAFRIRFTETNLRAAAAGTYSGTITVELAPE